MKITKIESFAGWAAWCNWYFLRVETDEGLIGWGEGALPGPLSAVDAAVKELSAVVVGLPFEGVEAAWQRMYHAWRWRGGAVANTAVSALDLAFWDLEGKRLGVPVYRLLGGALRKDVPSYSSHHMWTRPEAAARDARSVVDAGHTGLKWVLLSIWDNRDVSGSIHRTTDIIAAAREGCGDRCQIFIDCSEVLTADTAKRLDRALEPYRIGFLEEPLPFENVKALVQLKQEINTPIATGERLLSRWEYRELIEQGGADILQPDLMHAGGLTEVRKIACAADTYYLPIAPHNPAGPICTAASVHLGLAIPNFHSLETMDDEKALRDEICLKPLPFDHGVFTMPEGPGFGVELDAKKLQGRHYKPAPAGKAPKLWLG